MTAYKRLHDAADRLDQLAAAAEADYRKSHGDLDGYAGSVDDWLGGPVGRLAMVNTPDTARTIATILRLATCQRIVPDEITQLADLILADGEKETR